MASGGVDRCTRRGVFHVVKIHEPPQFDRCFLVPMRRWISFDRGLSRYGGSPRGRELLSNWHHSISGVRCRK